MPEPTSPASPPLPASSTPIVLSVVAPAHNESENVGPLVDEVGRAGEAAGVPFEFLIIDDGSTDDTAQQVRTLMASRPWLRLIRMTQTPTGKGGGQSAAFFAGFRATRGELVASLDADLQNDPADLPAMLRLLREQDADMVQGDRSHARRDTFVRRYGSVVGRLFRRLLLGDTVRDTGCSLRVMKREVALSIPLEFKGLHRFIPVTARQQGFKVVETRINHRPRVAGETKYGAGISKRALPGLIDCFGVRWLGARRRPVGCEEVGAGAAGSVSGPDDPEPGRTGEPQGFEVKPEVDSRGESRRDSERDGQRGGQSTGGDGVQTAAQSAAGVTPEGSAA